MTSGNRAASCAEELAGLGPVVHVHDAAAGMRVQPDDAHVMCSGERGELRGFARQHAEFRMHAGGTDMVVVTAPETRVDAHEDLAAAEHLRPGLERIQVVQGDMHAPLEPLLVLCARREIGREQHTLWIQRRNGREHVLELTLRDALDGETGGMNAPQDRGMPVRFHRIGPAADRLDLPYRGNRGIDARQVVDERGGLPRRRSRAVGFAVAALPTS